MSIYNQYNNIKYINQIKFDLLGENELLNISVLNNINKSELYENNSKPKEGGLLDPRLGISDNSSVCATCSYNFKYCDGHWGTLQLNEVMFNYNFLEIIKKILDCICLSCSNLLLPNNDVIKTIKNIKSNKNRLTFIKNFIGKPTSCKKDVNKCNAPVTKIKLEKKKATGSIIFTSTLVNPKDPKNSTVIKLTASKIYDIFKNISTENQELLGLTNRPEYLLYKYLPIPPVSIRPSVREFAAGMSKEDDLTRNLLNIINKNNKLNKKDINKKTLDINLNILQSTLIAYIDNDAIASNNVEIKGINNRLKGKPGRVRTNLLGKRADFTGRTVITADARIQINKLSVPLKIAMNLTIRETVSHQNYDKLSKYINNGRYIYPGANFVYLMKTSINDYVHPIDLRYRKEKIILEIGDIVERHLRDGDIVLLNRQPTLHKQSMMAHIIEVNLNPNVLTFRISLSVTEPYNADFDGDEMNIFVPQSIQSIIELNEIANVKYQITNAKLSNSLIGLKQDCIVGCYLITSEKTKLSRTNALNLLACTKGIDYNKLDYSKKEYSGQELLSLLIPSDITISDIISDSVIKKQFGKNIMGTGSNTLIKNISDAYNPDLTITFLTNMQRLINNFNLINGFSVGMQDIKIDNETKKIIDNCLKTLEIEIKLDITRSENNFELNDPSSLELNIYNKFQDVINKISKIILNVLPNDNNFNILVKSGAKGDILNVTQILGSRGLITSENGLIKKNYNYRTLPYFYCNEDSFESRGLVKQSYTEGLTYPQFVFELLSGRESLIEVVVKTADMGYAQRKIIKVMEDVMIKYDGTVRNNNNNIIQYLYGDTNINTTKQYDYTIKYIKMDDNEIIHTYDFGNKKYINNIVKYRNYIRHIMFKANITTIFMQSSFKFPLNLLRILNTKVAGNSILTAEYILKGIKDIVSYKNTKLYCINNTSDIKLIDEKISKFILKATMYDLLAPNILINKMKMSKESFDNIVSTIINVYNHNLIEAGEMVGIIASQSIGEPLTQMTIDTFHRAGMGSKKSTTLGGIPRLKELLSATKNIKTPAMEIYFVDKYKEKKDKINKIASFIKFITINNIKNNIQLFFEPDYNNGFIKNDKIIVKENTNLNNLPWLIRIEINKERMYEYDITLIDIKHKISNWWLTINNNKLIKKENKVLANNITNIIVLINNDNDEQPIVHIRLDFKNTKNNFNINLVSSIVKNIFNNIKIKGFDDIINYDVEEDNDISFDSSGKIVEKKQYYIITKGIDVINIRYIKFIDLTRTIINDVQLLHEIYGIEIARSVLLKQFIDVFEKSSKHINYQHLCLLVDIMTYNGFIISIDRHGINKSDADPLSRTSFEKVVEHMINASVFGEVDNITGVSANIMTGRCFKGGTAYCDIEVDYDMIKNSEYVSEYDTNNTHVINEIEINKIG